jgi:hypothetical protein
MVRLKVMAGEYSGEVRGVKGSCGVDVQRDFEVALPSFPLPLWERVDARSAAG